MNNLHFTLEDRQQIAAIIIRHPSFADAISEITGHFRKRGEKDVADAFAAIWVSILEPVLMKIAKASNVY